LYVNGLPQNVAATNKHWHYKDSDKNSITKELQLIQHTTASTIYAKIGVLKDKLALPDKRRRCQVTGRALENTTV